MEIHKYLQASGFLWKKLTQNLGLWGEGVAVDFISISRSKGFQCWNQSKIRNLWWKYRPIIRIAITFINQVNH